MSRHRPLALVCPFGLLLLVPLAACGGSHKGPDTDVRRASVLTEEVNSEGLLVQAIDVNGDGRADVFNYMREREDNAPLMVRKETDLNWDGRIDVRAWFDDSGVLEKEEMDGDFDGRVDWTDHYQGGKRVLSEIDTDFDGTYDLFKYYEGAKVRRKERDTDRDGSVDLWEYLDDQGRVVKTGRDLDGDGVMDVRSD
ncbi:MAG: hypothetical protein D6798_00140 [Deltaproteobacteria bacterium]|nr:MAG: hypothetical protein D6798_00140 [Deltaproteobacteria bacterium]